VSVFAGMRDGAHPRRVEARGGSGIFIKSSGTQDKMWVDSPNGTTEITGRETLFAESPGQSAQILRQPKILSTDEIEQWEEKSKEFEKTFERRVMGEDSRMETTSAVPAERGLWEALKRASTPTQVRNIYTRSKVWLIDRLELPNGSYWDWSWSPFPRALYNDAADFCRAKLDPRYPNADKRESADYRRIEYLARSMAGRSLSRPISVSYSVEVLRKLVHLDSCLCWRCRQEIAPRFPRSLARFLMEQK